MGKELEKDPSGTRDVKDTSSAAAVKDATATTVKMEPGAITKGSTLHHYPRISIFYGDNSTKGEVSWPTFKYEVEALIKEKIFTEEQILLGIRRAVKGTASDVLRRLGTGVTVEAVIKKLQSTFGSIETQEIALRKFYACQQEHNESVSTYASRIEEIFERATMLGGLKKDDSILKKVFYQGLRPEVKHLAFSKCDLIEDYDRFKIEVRKIEADLAINPKEEKQKCNAMLNTDKKEKSDIAEVKELLQKINQRVDKLEKEKEQARSSYDDGYSSFRTFCRSYQGNSGNQSGYRGNREFQSDRGNRGRGGIEEEEIIAHQGQQVQGLCSQRFTMEQKKDI